ncbi:hypothetical protein M9Y10_018627 [Tritrichomonas musculus]|uniref:Uncharacterized protein n=1 Tax=Tritrichomonas musculus TaxID=1915356 RepID=A0ABR2HMG9_9EUKA
MAPESQKTREKDEVIFTKKSDEYSSVLYEAINRHNSEITKFLLSTEKVNVNFFSKNFGDTSNGIKFMYRPGDEYHWKETALSKALKIFGSEDIEIFKLFLIHKDLKVDKQDIENAKSEEIKKIFKK